MAAAVVPPLARAFKSVEARMRSTTSDGLKRCRKGSRRHQAVGRTCRHRRATPARTGGNVGDIGGGAGPWATPLRMTKKGVALQSRGIDFSPGRIRIEVFHVPRDRGAVRSQVLLIENALVTDHEAGD